MLHFLRAGRELVEPLVMPEALCRVVYGRASADNRVTLSEAGEPIAVTVPWGSVEEAQQRLTDFIHATVVIHKRLQENVLSAYVENPTTGAYLRIPREYWLRHSPGGDYRLLPVDDATGWDSNMAGQPILVNQSDLAKWTAVAQEAIAKLRGIAPPPPVAEQDPEPLPVATRAEVQAWVRERIAANDTQDAICKALPSAFAGKRVKLNRDQVREIHRSEYQAMKGEVKPGRPSRNAASR